MASLVDHIVHVVPRVRPEASELLVDVIVESSKHARGLQQFKKLPAAELTPLTPEQLRLVDTDARNLVWWGNDGQCYNRAWLVANRISQLLDGRIAGPRDAQRAAVAFAREELGDAGTFHAAAVVRDGQGRLLAYDRTTGDGFAPLPDWGAKLGVPAGRTDEIEIHHALTHVPDEPGKIGRIRTREDAAFGSLLVFRSIDQGDAARGAHYVQD